MTDQDLEPKPLAQITIGPTAFEEFLDRNQGRLIFAAILLVLIGAGVIVAHNMRSDFEAEAAAAVTACYDEVTGKYDPAALSKVRTEYNDTPAAETATYLHAMTLWDDGRTDDSLKEMESFVTTYPDGPLHNQAAFILAGRELQSGKKEKAQQYFELVSNSGDAVFAPVALMTMGDMASLAGEKEKAKGYYEEVRVKYPDSSFAYDQKADMSQVKGSMFEDAPQFRSPVANRLDVLNLQSPKPVAPPVKLPSLDQKVGLPAPVLPPVPGK